MAKYQSGDIVTFYFVIKDMGSEKIIQGWTDNKEIAKFYIEFHKCKDFKLKKITNTIEEINKISEENWNDEIKLFNIITRNRNKKSKHDDNFETIAIPATETEIRFVREETSTFLASRINYGLLNEVIPYMKKKYRDVLESIFLTDIIRKVIYNKNERITQLVEIDQLMILYKSFPENFGKCYFHITDKPLIDFI